MLRIAFILLTYFALNLSVNAQTKEISFEELEQIKNNKKHIVVFIHTDWCKYCLQMENTTFKNKKVVSLIADHFLFIPLNAERKNSINFANHTFSFIPNGNNSGTHALAKELATIDGKINYPTICILNPKNEIVFQYGGFMDTEQIIAVLEALD